MVSAGGNSGLPNGLHVVSTPVGAARDITLRALDVLRAADVIAAEDTRSIRRLLDIHGVSLAGRRVVSYNDHNAARIRERLVGLAQGGQSVALVSDAGTPAIADPGYRLVRAFQEAGLAVTPAPGPSAVLAALSVSGQPTDRFMFAGFPPPRQAARMTFLTGLANVQATLVLFESPARIAASLSDMISAFGSERPVTVCRELTKKFEEVTRGTLSELSRRYPVDGQAATRRARGEFVLVLGPPPESLPVEDAEIDRFLASALNMLRPRDAAKLAAECLGVQRRRAYARAVELEHSRS